MLLVGAFKQIKANRVGKDKNNQYVTLVDVYFYNPVHV